MPGQESLPLIANRYYCDVLFADVERAAASADWSRCGSIVARYTEALRRRICAEESVLFPAFLRTVAGTRLPIRHIRCEHIELWRLLSKVQSALGNENGEAFLACCGDFLCLLRRHIACEERVLYPIAERVRLVGAACTLELPS